MEKIVSGLVSLYKLESSYFIEKDNGGLRQLRNDLEETVVDGRQVFRYSNQHVATISMYMFDCVELRPRIQRIALAEKLLVRLVEDYNRCKGQESTTFVSQKPWTKVFFALTGGIVSSQLAFEGDLGFGYNAGDFESSRSAITGISLDFLSPRLSERISLHADFLYTYASYFRYDVVVNGPLTMRNSVTIELSQIKIPLAFRYTFPEKRLTPYFNAGLSSTIHLRSEPEWIQEVETSLGVQTSRQTFEGIKKDQFGLWAGAGLLTPITKNLHVFGDFRYESTNGIAGGGYNPQEGLSSSVRNVCFLVGIRTR